MRKKVSGQFVRHIHSQMDFAVLTFDDEGLVAFFESLSENNCLFSVSASTFAEGDSPLVFVNVFRDRKILATMRYHKNRKLVQVIKAPPSRAHDAEALEFVQLLHDHKRQLTTVLRAIEFEL
jgi:hypothetical protein